MNFLITCDPATVNHCLNTHFEKYPKGREFAEMFDILGDGLLMAESESWDEKVGNVLLRYLDHMAKHGSKIELEDVFTGPLLDVSYSTVFTADLHCLSVSSPMPVFGRATKEVEEALLFKHLVPSRLWKFLRWLNVGIEKKLADAKVMINQVIYEEMRSLTYANTVIAEVFFHWTLPSAFRGMQSQTRQRRCNG
ncbi:hypothetical protein U9M48_004937 [Paspalum notatum var. saurae]|uniref:Cytochrome P450 n=1 Tax=Paspalum notatum var. saurae TaxID=547442 RepID=A0AAQ3PUB1_PASNO